MKLQLKFVTMVEPMGCGKVQRPTPQHNNREGCSSRVFFPLPAASSGETRRFLVSAADSTIPHLSRSQWSRRRKDWGESATDLCSLLYSLAY